MKLHRKVEKPLKIEKNMNAKKSKNNLNLNIQDLNYFNS